MYNNSRSKSNPFKTPDSYFPHLEKCIFSKIIIKNNAKYPWKTPNNYLENLEKNILNETVKKVNSKKPKIIILFSKKIYWISAAACLFFAILLNIYSSTNNSLALTYIENQKTFSDNLYAPNSLDLSKSSFDLPSSTNKIIQKSTEHIKEKTLEQEVITSSHVIYDLYLANDENTNLYDEETSKDNFILF
jgi:hypothetical protein